MKEIDARTAIKKFRDIQVELREIQRACMLIGYSDVTHIISEIQSLKIDLDKQCEDPIFS